MKITQWFAYSWPLNILFVFPPFFILKIPQNSSWCISHFTNTSCDVTVPGLQVQDCPYRSSIIQSPVAINTDDALMIGCAALYYRWLILLALLMREGFLMSIFCGRSYVTLCLLSFAGNVVGVAINHLNAFDGRHLLYTHNCAQWRN